MEILLPVHSFFSQLSASSLQREVVAICLQVLLLAVAQLAGRAAALAY